MCKRIYYPALIVLLIGFFSCHKDKIKHPNQSASFIKYFGGAANQTGYSAKQTLDGGYIFVGKSSSFGNENQIYIVKTDESGNEQWSRNFGNAGNDEARDVLVLNTGYAVTGTLAKPNASGPDSTNLYLLLLDDQGNKIKDFTYGIPGENASGNTLTLASDNGFILIGNIDSASNENIFIVKTDASGKQAFWSPKTRGGAGDVPDSAANSVIDLGQDFVFAFSSIKLGRNTPVVAEYDYSSGIELNAPTNSDFGASNLATAVDLQKTTDGGFILTGMTGPVPGSIYLLKLDGNLIAQWNKVLDMRGQQVSSVTQTTDGGFILASSGNTDKSGKDLFLIKTDASGGIQWNTHFGGSGDDEAYSAIQTTEGGYLLSGTISFGSTGASNTMMCLIKTDKNGNLQ